MADFAGIRMTRRIEEIRVVSFLPEFFLSAKKISRAERSTPSYLPSRRREPSWWKEGGDRPRGSNRGNKEGREEGRRERCAFHASILALKCDSRERGQNAEISVYRPPSLAEFTAPSTSEMRSFGISRRGGGKGNKDIVRRVCDANNAYTYLCNRCWYSFDVYPDESPHPFFFSNYDIFISPPLVSYILSKGHEAFLEWKKGFEIFPFSSSLELSTSFFPPPWDIFIRGRYV